MSLRTNVLTLLLIVSYARLTLSIVGGHRAQTHQFPYLVSIVAYLKNSPHLRNVCSGSILTPYWILTAAHCIVAIHTEFLHFKVFVLAGKIDIGQWEPTEQFALIQSYHKHENFTSFESIGGYDLGLLKLHQSLHFNRWVAPIGVSVRTEEPWGRAVISGWGAIKNTREGDNVFPRFMQTTIVQIINRAVCRLFARTILQLEGMPYLEKMVDDSHICTASLSEGNSACTGDSGSPLVQNDDFGFPKIIGVVSYMATPCGRVGGPTVYVKVANFVGWIMNVIYKN